IVHQAIATLNAVIPDDACADDSFEEIAEHVIAPLTDVAPDWSYGDLLGYKCCEI
ncbi:hypothetical protein A2U01_0029382, partial [Trifolium medium]|nr:hypothetical protein [Trifolium medium]